MGIRLRLYGCERMRRERLIGEAVVSFANINLELENNFWLPLESRSNTTVCDNLFSEVLKILLSYQCVLSPALVRVDHHTVDSVF